MGLQICNGRIIDPANDVDRIGDLLIDDGVIVGIDVAPDNFVAERKIDASNQIVCPGLIDLAVRLHDLAQQHKTIISGEISAAVASGITTICCSPDTEPVIDTPAATELILQRALDSQQSRVLPLGALTSGLQGQKLVEMDALRCAGCVGLSNGNAPIVSTEVLRRAFEYAQTCDMTVHLYCNDGFLGHGGVAHEGAVALRLGLPAIPEVAETIAISRALLLIEQIGCRVHFCRLSTARGVAMLADARARGLNVSADVGIAYLYLTEMDVADFNTDCLVLPPFRSQRDMQQLREGLADGVIGSICSDHQPHGIDAKSVPFSMAEPGASTIEMLLPLALRLQDEAGLTLKRLIAALTCVPADIVGADTGNLAVGRPADVCVFDPELFWTVDRDDLLSSGKNTPFTGWPMTGKVTHTVVAGNVVYQYA